MGKSSKDKRDIYYRLAKEHGYRARSAFKLLHLHQQHNLLHENIARAVDLCAAPGSWTQVLAETLKPSAQIVAVDLQLIAPFPNHPNITLLQGDITSESTRNRILSCFQNSRADLVVCDGAPDVTGLHDMDEFFQLELVQAALSLALDLLDPKAGKFVAKVFRGPDFDLLLQMLENIFERVIVSKPASSRNSSIEAFVICECILEEEARKKESASSHLFLACNDFYDSDVTYALEDGHVVLKPVQQPTCPPYKTAVTIKRSNPRS